VDVAVELPQHGHCALHAVEADLGNSQLAQALQQGVAHRCPPAHQQVQLMRLLYRIDHFSYLFPALSRQFSAFCCFFQEVDGYAFVPEGVHLLVVEGLEDGALCGVGGLEFVGLLRVGAGLGVGVLCLSKLLLLAGLLEDVVDEVGHDC
jgi:hypothetical protein